MRTLLILCMLFLFSYSLTAQTKKPGVSEVSFTLKTDFLSILNSAIDKNTSDISVSGELCLNRKYSLQVNTNFEKENNTDYNRSQFMFNSEFRSYLQNDECSCSSLHVGAYVGFGNTKTIIDHRAFEYKYIKYSESTFESGLAGGYRAVIYNRWIVDPTVYVGASTVFSQRTIESINFFHDVKPVMLTVRIGLEFGYRF